MSTESINKITICQKCGDKGRQKDLVFCGQCKTAAEHQYCLHVMPKKGEKVSWSCEDCCPTFPKAAPSRKSGRISQAVKRKMARIERLKEECIPEKKHSAFIGKSTPIEPKKSKRRLIIDDESDADEESQPIQDEHVQLPPPVLPSSQFDGDILVKPANDADEESQPIQDEHVQLPPPPVLPSSQIVGDILVNPANDAISRNTKFDELKIGPLSDAIWRGTFDIRSVGGDKSLIKLHAHVSNGACPLVRYAAVLLKPLLHMEALMKPSAWPKRFKEFPPNGNDIALYFFPENESSNSDERMHEVIYNSLLEFMLKQEIILKTIVGAAELLVFHSSVLPPDFQRYEEKYYLWGVCIQRNNITSTSRPNIALNMFLGKQSNDCFNGCCSSIFHCCMCNTYQTCLPRSAVVML